jgi:hypothetical protein
VDIENGQHEPWTGTGLLFIPWSSCLIDHFSFLPWYILYPEDIDLGQSSLKTMRGGTRTCRTWPLNLATWFRVRDGLLSVPDPLRRGGPTIRLIAPHRAHGLWATHHLMWSNWIGDLYLYARTNHRDWLQARLTARRVPCAMRLSIHRPRNLLWPRGRESSEVDRQRKTRQINARKKNLGQFGTVNVRSPKLRGPSRSDEAELALRMGIFRRQVSSISGRRLLRQHCTPGSLPLFLQKRLLAHKPGFVFSPNSKKYRFVESVQMHPRGSRSSRFRILLLGVSQSQPRTPLSRNAPGHVQGRHGIPPVQSRH